MANAIFNSWKQALIQGTANTSLTGTVKVALIDTGVYTYSAAHDFYNDVSGVVGTPGTLASKTYTNGVLDAADLVFSALSGNSIEAIIIYIDTGTPSTSYLVAYMDTGFTTLPATPNGGDLTLVWNASGIIGI